MYTNLHLIISKIHFSSFLPCRTCCTLWCTSTRRPCSCTPRRRFWALAPPSSGPRRATSCTCSRPTRTRWAETPASSGACSSAAWSLAHSTFTSPGKGSNMSIIQWRICFLPDYPFWVSQNYKNSKNWLELFSWNRKWHFSTIESAVLWIRRAGKWGQWKSDWTAWEGRS